MCEPRFARLGNLYGKSLGRNLRHHFTRDVLILLLPQAKWSCEILINAVERFHCTSVQ